MPRKRRFFIPDVPVHIVQRGHSRKPVFFENDDYSTYLHYLVIKELKGSDPFKVM